MSFEWSNGTKQGIDRTLQAINAQQNRGGPGLLGGLFGANQLRGGITLNPDGTVNTIAPVAPKHHILDAIFNGGDSARESAVQNALVQKMGLATTQGITTGHAQTQDLMQLQAQKAAQLQDTAVKQSLMDYGKANNITVFRPDGSLTDAGSAAMQTLDPEKVKATVSSLQQQEAIAADPQVQAARKAEAISQAQTAGVDNAAKSRVTTPLGGTTTMFDPANPLNPVGTATGGTTHSSSISEPVVKMFQGIPYPMGEQSRTESGVDAGGYQKTAIPDTIKDMIRTTNPDGTVKEAATEPHTSTADKPVSKWGTALQGVIGAAQAIADSQNQPKATVDLSTANNLINQGATAAAQPITTPAITGGYPVMDGGNQALNPGASPFASQSGGDSAQLAQLLELLKQGGHGVLNFGNAMLNPSGYADGQRF